MARKYPYVAGTLAVVSLLGSFLLIPREQERALMHYKNRQFEKAQTAYQEQVAQGQLNIEVATQLARLHLQNGDIEKAIDIMSKFVEANPANVEARKELGNLYQYAQRTEDYIRNLEAINKIRPDRETLERLADIYSFNAQHEKNLQALEELVALGPDSSPKYYLSLAQLQAAGKKRTDAIATLKALKKSHPESFGFEETRFFISLLLDENQPQEAFQAAEDWRQQTKSIDEVAGLANLLHYKSNPEMGLKLLQPYEAEIDKHPSVLKEYTMLLLDTNRNEQAFNQLNALYQRGNLPAEMNQQLLVLASARGDEKLLNSLTAKIDLRSLSDADAANLAELAILRKDTVLLKQLQSTFDSERTQNSHPFASTLLAIDAGTPNAEAQLRTLEAMPLSSPQRIMLARACTRAKNTACVRRAISALPEPENMSDAELANLGNLYLEIGLTKEGAEFMDRYAGDRNSAAIDVVRMNFDAARGKRDRIIPWLDANSELATTQRMRTLYYNAMNNGHFELASDIAERLYTLNPSTEHRTYLAYVYMKSNRFDQAIVLLGDAADRSEEDERNYLTALVERAALQPEHAKELTDYANAHLSGSPSDHEKLAILYALARARKLDHVLPYLKEFAVETGGTWAAAYAKETAKLGNPAEARIFWLRAAMRPGISDREKTSIAFNLLALGYVTDAQFLFFDIAQNKPPQSDEVQRVLYLWGPRPTIEQLEWMYSRFEKAPLKQKAGWGKMMLNYTSAETLDELVNRHPEMLNNPTVARRYFELLQERGKLGVSTELAIKAAEQTGNYEMLRQFARTSSDYMHRKPARQTYAELLKKYPHDAEALAILGFTDFGLADYSESEKHLAEYLELPVERRHKDKTWRAYFYMAEMMRREQEDDLSQDFYRKTLEEIRTHELDDADALSAEAQAMVWLGEEDEGLEHFRTAIQKHPDNEVLRLDYVSTLLAVKKYDLSGEQLKIPPQLAIGSGTPGPALPIPEAGLRGYQLYNNNSELVLNFASNKQGRAAFPATTQAAYPWIAFITDSFDQTMITAKDGYTLELVRDENNKLLLVARPVSDISAHEVARQIRLRHELLAARQKLETGYERDSITRLAALADEYPDDPQLMGYTANVLNYIGNWQRATRLISRAREMNPENEDFVLLQHEIEYYNAQGLKLDHEYQKRGRDKLHITTLTGVYLFSDEIEVGAEVQHVKVQAKNKRRADGRLGNFTGNRERGEIYIAHNDDDGDRAKAALYANTNTLGAGLYYEWRNQLGTTEFAGELRRPYWGFVEGILDEATRDRLGITHTHRINPRLTITGNLSLNRYHVEDFNNVASTYGFGGGIFYILQELKKNQTQITLGYGLDAEYAFTRKGLYTNTNQFYRPFPFQNREIHAVSLQFNRWFTEDTRGDLLLSYGFDRHGGHGPGIEGRLTHEFDEDWDAQIRAAYGIDNSNSDSNITRLGGYVRYKLH